MATTTYNFLKRLVNKITKSDAPLNNSFSFYNTKVLQTSGTFDYTDVFVSNKYNGNTIVSFTFDFLTKDLIFDDYIDEKARNVVAYAFNDIYGNGNVLVKDNAMNEYIKDLEASIEDCKKDPDFTKEDCNNIEREYREEIKQLKQDLEKLNGL